MLVNSLTKDDEHLLCGRAGQVRALLDNCVAGRVTVVSSLPCFGITSFLEAGARPALEREDCIVVSFSQWAGRFFGINLREKVAAAVRHKSGMDFPVDSDDLEAILHRGCRKTGCRIVLMLDQFEDYLRCHAGNDSAEAFDAELGRAAQLMGAAPLLFGLQDHSLEAFRRLQQLIPNLFGGHITLPALTHADAMLRVQREAEWRTLELEPAAAEALTATSAASTEGGIHPFLFIAGLNRLVDAEIRMRSGSIRASTIQEYGGADKLILQSLDATFAGFSSTHTELFFRWCNILIGPDGKRQSATEQALTEYAGKLNRFVLTLMPVVTGTNLMRSLEVRDELRYEIARDGLVPIVRHWWREREATLVARSRAQFRVRSLSVAFGTIVVLYLLWLYLSVPR